MMSNEDLYQVIKKANVKVPSEITSWIPLKKILWILLVSKDTTQHALSVEGISYLAYKLLEENLSERTVKNTIARAGDLIMKRKDNFYEITKRGREKLEVKPLIGKEIFYVTGDRPWTDRNSKFPSFIKELEGEILILDPYYGLGTLHILSQFSKDKKMRFLSGQLGNNENQAIFSKELVRFKKEFRGADLKIYPKNYELHDRYIVSNNYLILIGHGIKDIGDKECFLIAIPSEEVSEVITNIRTKFEERWNKSNNLT